ncbi:MAG TPA: 6-phosphogluconolactonase [Mycobacteriales bacterium]|nr:6-phosphogluconolactonase [Mycobacteriales bacterium]
MSGPTVVVHRDPSAVAESAAERLVPALVDAQRDRGSASLVLSGGGLGIAVLAALREEQSRLAVDWSRVDVWWGDERYLPHGDPDRNETQARAALLDHLDLAPERVHPMPALDGPDGKDVDAAAARYAAELAGAAPHGTGVPRFDVLLLGMGAEGHVGSVFPESPAAHDERSVVGVHGCPKPPPTRITLGFAALTAAREVWLLVAGAQKASAVAMALSGAGRVALPAAGAVGRKQTLWLLDEAAAGQLPPSLRRL